MKLLLLILLAGCAASLDTLMNEAKDCTEHSISPTGVIGQPTDEQRTGCWMSVNSRLDANERRREKREANQCPSGLIKYCDGMEGRGGRCSCVRKNDIFGY